MRDASAIDGELIPVDRYTDLAADWRALEALADGSPFTAWLWVSVWLRNLPARVRPFVFRARDGEGVLALTLLVDAAKRPLRSIVGGRALLLQETGDLQIDDITIEYAGVLARRGSESRAYAALFDTLSRTRRWQSLHISASTHARAVRTALPDDLRALRSRQQSSWLVDLASVRATGGDYIARLGSSTRSGLRKTRRVYAARGEIRAEIAREPGQALEWLHELRELHERHWRTKGKPGSFGSVFFTAFHSDLVREGTMSGCVHLMRITAGSLVVGYLYNLHWRNRVYFYNGGLNYGALARHDRPGYLAHLAAIEKYLRDGAEQYDFLAGNADYKRAMSTHMRTLGWLQIQRIGWRSAGQRLCSMLGARRGAGAPLIDPPSGEPVALRE